MKNLEKLAIFLVVAVTVFLVYQYTGMKHQVLTNYEEPQTQKEVYSTWPPFSAKVKHNNVRHTILHSSSSSFFFIDSMSFHYINLYIVIG